MQAASNFLQDKVLGGPLPVDQNAAPEWNEREGESQKALTWQAVNKVELKDMPVPDITEDKDVILRVTGSTICGSDLHLYHGEIVTMQKEDILGHEFMGIVDKVGPGVKKVKVGDRVVASFQAACGTCKFCQKKLSSFCDRTNNSSLMKKMYGQNDAAFFGYSHFTGGLSGGQAEFVRVPFGDVNLLKIPDGVPDEQALFLSDVLPTSYHTIVDTEVGEGDIVGIWGLGPIGLCAARWAQIKGAKRVIGIDLVPSRLAYAKEKLGIDVLDVSGNIDVGEAVLKLVPDGLDVAIDAGSFHEEKTWLHYIEKKLMLETDQAETINECIKSVRKRGRVGLIAAYSSYANHVNVGSLMEKGVRLQGNGQAPVHLYWEEILNDYLIPGKFSTELMVTHRVPIDDFKELYDKFDRRVGGVMKVFVETKFSSPPSPGFPKTTRAKDIAETTDVNVK